MQRPRWTMEKRFLFFAMCNTLCIWSPIHLHVSYHQFISTQIPIKKIVSENQPKLVSFRPTMTLAILHLLLLFNFAFSDWVGDLEMKVGIFWISQFFCQFSYISEHAINDNILRETSICCVKTGVFLGWWTLFNSLKTFVREQKIPLWHCLTWNLIQDSLQILRRAVRGNRTAEKIIFGNLKVFTHSPITSICQNEIFSR